MIFDDTVLISFKKNITGKWVPQFGGFSKMFEKYTNEELEKLFNIIENHHCIRCKVKCNDKGEIIDILALMPAKV